MARSRSYRVRYCLCSLFLAFGLILKYATVRQKFGSIVPYRNTIAFEHGRLVRTEQA